MYCTFALYDRRGNEIWNIYLAIGALWLIVQSNPSIDRPSSAEQWNDLRSIAIIYRSFASYTCKPVQRNQPATKSLNEWIA